MYLKNEAESLVVVLTAAKDTLDCPIICDINDHDANGMITPQDAAAVTTNGTTEVTITTGQVDTNRQIARMTLYNNDTDIITAIFSKKISGTLYGQVKAEVNPGATLVYSKDGSWSIFDTASKRRTVLRTFTANTTYEPGDFSYAWATCIGAGGGAGSGRRGAAGSNRFGGGGGGGGAISTRFFSRAEMADSIALTIGTGGIGGAAVTSDATNGKVGTVGGDTSFGGLILAKGGNAGGGGSTTAGTAGSGGQLTSCIPIASPFSLSGANGTAGNTTTNAAGVTGLLGTGCPGGGGGGGINSANASGVAANSGGAVYQNGTILAGPTSGASPNGVDNKSLAIFQSSSIMPLLGIGTGGAGNNPATPNGGDGGNYGAGGGGGAGVLDGSPSGKGGDGGDGIIIVMEIYA